MCAYMLDTKIFISNVKVRNYRSLIDLDIRLNNGLNIIIGKNGAGKSNFLKFLYGQIARGIHWNYLRMLNPRLTLPGRYSYTFDIALKNKREDSMFRISSEYRAKAGPGPGKFDLDERVVRVSKFENGKAVFRNVESSPLSKSKSRNDKSNQLGLEMLKLGTGLAVSFVRFRIPDHLKYVSGPGDLFIENPDNYLLEEDYSGYDNAVPAVLPSALFGNQLDKLVRASQVPGSKKKLVDKKAILDWFEERKQKYEYVDILKHYSPIEDIRLNEHISTYQIDYGKVLGNIMVEFKVDGRWVPWPYMTDGTKRLFHIITETVFSDGQIILIEEPEVGIHPDQVYKLLYFLREFSRKRQIIISTHSPISLDVLKPENLDEIIIAKMTEEGTKMAHLSAEQREKAIEYITEVGSLSDYWLHSDLEIEE